MSTTLPTTPPELVVLTTTGARVRGWRVTGPLRVVLPRVPDGGEGGSLSVAAGAQAWVVGAGGAFWTVPVDGAARAADVDAVLMDVSGTPAAKE